MHSLLLKELVSCEGVEGEEATNIPDVGLEDGDIASLDRRIGERKAYLIARCKK